MITTGELKRGFVIELDKELWSVQEYQHLKLGRGSAQVRMKLKNVRTGANVEKTVQAGERFPRVRLDHHTVQFLYAEDGQYHLMDTETYDQLALTEAMLGDNVKWMTENMTLDLLTYGDEPIDVELPITVELEIVETEPGFKGDTATGGNKPAKVSTGATVQVPLFVSQGDRIKIDTRTGAYLERA
ncbi:MAG TPA: elongation factor P [Chloroflexota bacterium]|nr:elongation factor P [Chloroflexota bacterium]